MRRYFEKRVFEITPNKVSEDDFATKILNVKVPLRHNRTAKKTRYGRIRLKMTSTGLALAGNIRSRAAYYTIRSIYYERFNAACASQNLVEWRGRKRCSIKTDILELLFYLNIKKRIEKKFLNLTNPLRKTLNAFFLEPHIFIRCTFEGTTQPKKSHFSKMSISFGIRNNKNTFF